jgi:uncharacterized membrane protein
MTERNAKREQFTTKKANGKKLLLPLAVLFLAVVAGGGWYLLARKSPGGHTLVQAGQNGTISFAATDFSDGKARFYRFQGQSGPIDFFVVRSMDGVVRAAFDTCDVCYREHKGYRQEGGDMVCNNCGQHFRTDLVNVLKGGCNPAPLQRQLASDKVVIAVNDLEQGAGYFQAAIN